ALREATSEALEQLKEPTLSALSRERAALLTSREQGLLFATAFALLAGRQGHLGLRGSVAAFLLCRHLIAYLARQPDPRILVPRSALRTATKRMASLGVEAALLATVSAALCGCALSTGLYLVGKDASLRISLLSKAVIHADTSKDDIANNVSAAPAVEVLQLAPATSIANHEREAPSGGRTSGVEISSGWVAVTRSWLNLLRPDLARVVPNATAAVKGENTAESDASDESMPPITLADEGDNNATESEPCSTLAMDHHKYAAKMDSSSTAAVNDDVDAAKREANTMAGERESVLPGSSLLESDSKSGWAVREGGASHRSLGEAASCIASGSASEWELASKCAWHGGAHALLAVSASMWAGEAAYVLWLGLLQRAWLVLLLIAARTVEQGRRFRRYWPSAQQRAQVSQLPNNQYDAHTSDLYLQNWLTGSKRSSKSSRSSDLQSWWDLNLVGMKEAWVVWQQWTIKFSGLLRRNASDEVVEGKGEDNSSMTPVSSNNSATDIHKQQVDSRFLWPWCQSEDRLQAPPWWLALEMQRHDPAAIHTIYTTTPPDKVGSPATDVGRKNRVTRADVGEAVRRGLLFDSVATLGDDADDDSAASAGDENGEMGSGAGEGRFWDGPCLGWHHPSRGVDGEALKKKKNEVVEEVGCEQDEEERHSVEGNARLVAFRARELATSHICYHEMTQADETGSKPAAPVAGGEEREVERGGASLHSWYRRSLGEGRRHWAVAAML
ncbi:MAG: hypothetical protein SGPRY_002877, partial [Prymnesium sp.]